MGDLQFQHCKTIKGSNLLCTNILEDWLKKKRYAVTDLAVLEAYNTDSVSVLPAAKAEGTAMPFECFP